MAKKCYARGGAVSTTDDRRPGDPVPGTKAPPRRGSTGGGLNTVPAASVTPSRPTSIERSPGNVPRSAGGALNANTLKMVPAARRDQEREVLGYKKGGIIPARASLPGAARRMGAQFGQGKGESAMKPADKKSPPPVGAKPTKGGFGQGSGPVKDRSSSPIRKKFI